MRMRELTAIEALLFVLCVFCDVSLCWVVMEAVTKGENYKPIHS